MDYQMFRTWASFILFWMAFSHCVRIGSFESMDVDKLAAVIDYIRSYGVQDQYAMAVRLDSNYCNNPNVYNLQAALPRNEMRAMNAQLRTTERLYNPENIGNIVAARPKKISPRAAQHAEWRLLTGGNRSPIERMLAGKDQNSCLFFFSKLSPCVDYCLDENSMWTIVQTINSLFNRFNEQSRAFIFESVYPLDSTKEATVVVNAWRRIQNAPLFRYPLPPVKCFGNNNQPADNSPCLNQ